MIKQRETNSWKSVSYAKSITGAQTYTKFPIVLRTTEQSIPTWSVKGNTETSGTPSLLNPVDVVGVGERTENLWNEVYTGISDNLRYQALYVGDGQFTMSTNASRTSEYAALLFFLAGNVSSGASTVTNGVWGGQTRTVTSIDGYVTVVYRTVREYTPVGSQTIINSSSTAKPYEPYGYKIPITSEGENLFDKDSADVYEHSTLGNANEWSYNPNSTGVVLRMPCYANTQYTLTIGSDVGNTIFRISEISTDNVPIEGSTGGYVCNTILSGGAINSHTFTTASDTKYILLQVNANVTTAAINTLMLNTGSTALPYSPYNHTTTPIYLGSVQSTRQIKKIVLKGDDTETWSMSDSTFGKRFSMTLTGAKQSDTSTVATICSHLPLGVAGATYSITDTYTITAASVLYISRDGTYTSVADFKAWLATEYANGTPVTLWYAFAPTETATVNEPLMKIGNYADTLSNAASIPTTLGLNTIDVNTTVKPSEMSLTYDGYKICKHKRKSENLLPTAMSDWQQGGISSADGTDTISTIRLRTIGYYPIANDTYYYISVRDTSYCYVNLIFYDSNKNFIGQYYTIDGAINGATALAIRIPSSTFQNVAYYRAVVKKQNESTITVQNIIDVKPMLNTGSTALPYAPYWQ